MAQLSSLGSIRHFVKHTFASIALIILLTACSRSDEKLSHEVAGVWKIGTVHWNFNSDGSFSNWTSDSGGTNAFRGTWQIQDSVLTMVLTNESGPKADGRLGAAMRLQIVSVDAHHIKFKSGGGALTR
jgi:hypothetical protein